MDSIENLNDTTYDSTYFYFLSYLDIRIFSEITKNQLCNHFNRIGQFEKFERYHV